MKNLTSKRPNSRTTWSTTAAICAVVLVLAGCSASDSGGVVRSDNGPSVNGSAAESSSAGADTSDPDGSPEESPAASPPSVAPPTTSSMLRSQGKVKIPDGAEGALSVVLTGGLDDTGSVPVVVRNRTDQVLSNLEVTGTARAADGGLVGSGASQGLVPALVNPGEWAFGYVYFDGSEPPAGATFDLTATGAEPDDFGSVDAEIAEVERVSGDYGDQFVGIVRNPSATDEIGGPIDVMIMCFDGKGAPLSTPRGYAKAESLPPSATSPFSVDLFDEPCVSWAMGSTGFSF